MLKSRVTHTPFLIMKSPIHLLQSLALAICFASAATAQTFSSPPPEIVSAWKLNGENAIAVFTHDGQFYTIIDSAETVGMERGTFTWDNVTHDFQADTIVDTNGDEGFSHPDGATSITISGDILSYSVVGEPTLTFNRVVNTASAIVGSWYIPGERLSLTFLGDGSYYTAQQSNDAPFGYHGIERGTYTWASTTTKAFTATALTDTNGDTGLSDLGAPVTVNITGNSMVFSEGEDTFTLRRITPVAAPLNASNDFEVDKFANYRQTGDVEPQLLTGSPTNPNDDYPFWGEAFISPDILGSAGTLSITGKPVLDFVQDTGGAPDGDDFHEWDIETQYTSLTLLNDAFPNGANYIFTRPTEPGIPGGSATLSFPAGGTFPVAPKIQLGEGTWSGGKYLLGADQTLTWVPISGYDPATMVTVISVIYDTPSEYDEIFKEDVIQGDITSYDLSGKLEPGRTYSVQLEHVKIASSTNAGTGPFATKLGYALYNSNTRFEMVAPEFDAPVITQQPVSQLGVLGSPLVITVGINEEAFPSSIFQWFRNGAEVVGQTGNSLYIPSFDRLVHTGIYDVIAINPEGVATSQTVEIGQAVTSLELVKSKYSRQLSDSQFQADIRAGFDARVEGVGITATFPAAALTLTKPNNSIVSMIYDGDCNDNDHWDTETYFANAAARDSTFPDGLYRINIGSDSVPISIGAGSYLIQPLITPSAGTWVGGKLRITAAEAAAGFTLTTNSLTSAGKIRIDLIDQTDDELVSEENNREPGSPDFLQVSVSAGLLAVGQSYRVETEFSRGDGLGQPSGYAWINPLVCSASNVFITGTVIDIEVVPDPLAGVERLIVSKRRVSQQQSPTLLADFGAGFDARVEGFGITSTFPASSINLRKPDSSTVALALDGDHWDAETDFASLSALQAVFPNGTYSINIGADSIPINMGTGSYPKQPLVTSSKGTWVGGKLRVTASEAAAGFSITTNSTTGNGYVSLYLIDSNDDDLVNVTAHTTPGDPAFAVGMVTPGLLTVGQTYEVEAEFDNVINSSDISTRSWAANNSTAFGLYSTTTVFIIEVVADSVASYTNWQTGFFNSTQLANPAISADDADSDNDGLDNLLEFVLGGSPVVNSAGLLKTATTTPAAIGRNLVFFYDRKTSASGISVVIETSPSLTNGTWTPAVHGVNNVSVVTTTLDANTERVTATVPSTETKLFVRLRANR